MNSHSIPRRKRQCPRILAIRFRAWQIAQSADCEITKTDLAAELDLPPAELRRAIKGQAWARQLTREKSADLDATEAASRFAKGIFTT